MRTPTPNQFPITAEMDPVRAKLDEYLTGMALVRDGTFNIYFIETEVGGRGISIPPENVDAEEQRLRQIFGERYPDLAPVSEEEDFSRGEN